MSRNIFVAGAKGMVGSAIVRQLKGLLEVEVFQPNRQELDLRCAADVQKYFIDNKISEVYLGEYLSGRINLYGYEK